jgi:hybrid cluster-associated redox disulfide protein
MGNSLVSSVDLETLSVAEIMRRWPSTIRVFLDFRLLCVGCPVGSFQTLADAAREHHVEPIALQEAVGKAIKGAQADPLRLPRSASGHAGRG